MRAENSSNSFEQRILSALGVFTTPWDLFIDAIENKAIAGHKSSKHSQKPDQQILAMVTSLSHLIVWHKLFRVIPFKKYLLRQSIFEGKKVGWGQP